MTGHLHHGAHSEQCLAIGGGPGHERCVCSCHHNLPAAPAVELVGPDQCACRGKAPQMREHTRAWCSVLTSAEVDELLPQSLAVKLEGVEPICGRHER